MKNKKVLFVATVVKKHINVFHLPYLQWFQEQGYETHVCARDDFNGEKCVIPYCDKHFDIPFERSPINKNNIKAYRQLKKIIDENNYDIIHCHTPVAAMLTRFAARKARKRGTKVIYTAHGFHFFKGAPLINWLIYFPVEWLCSFLTDILITINQEDYFHAKKFFRATEIEYIPGVGLKSINLTNTSNRTEKRRIIGIPQDAVLLLSIGEVNKNKNHKIIIESLSKQPKNVHYCIVGEGNLRSKLEEMVQELNLNQRVYFLGYRNDIEELCSIADIFCFPSYREGLSVSLMEAMRAGLPVLASKIRGNVDLVDHQRGGFLFKPDNKESLNRMLRQLVDNPDDCRVMGDYNKRKVLNFSEDLVMEKVIKIYSKCLNN